MKTKSPLYQRIAQQMRTFIETGDWAPGEAIPTEAQLVEKFKASRVTIRQAVKLLQEEGLLWKRQGSGTYVQSEKMEHNMYELKSFTEDMRQEGKEVTSKVLTFTVQTPNEKVREALKLEADALVYYVRRLRFANDEPLIVEDTYLPVQLFPDLTYEVMTRSKYDYIENIKNLKIADSVQEFIPVLPPKEIAEMLEVSDRTPILKVMLYSFLMDGSRFEFTETYFKSEEYRFIIRAGRRHDTTNPQ
ncbi:GntR family transcriptional regulator [Exiguobacterium qingdaonense]|uniref:GntR family transcriptional regulator n=1 Tax=Exiguobacterium qingdaonense TaxID=2751251 RepID=UPI001BE54F73|nr:GntR family transcriptional regulator [Exiguobacterium qingdaonense]